jgi:hypothetical protein
MHIDGSREGVFDMLFPRKDEVLQIHRKIIERFGGMAAGLVSRNEVEARFASWVVPSAQDINPKS